MAKSNQAEIDLNDGSFYCFRPGDARVCWYVAAYLCRDRLMSGHRDLSGWWLGPFWCRGHRKLQQSEAHNAQYRRHWGRLLVEYRQVLSWFFHYASQGLYITHNGSVVWDCFSPNCDKSWHKIWGEWSCCCLHAFSLQTACSFSFVAAASCTLFVITRNVGWFPWLSLWALS